MKALYNRHEEQVQEMKKRGWKAGYNHPTPLLPISFATGKPVQDEFIYTKQQHIKTLRERSRDKNRRCNCKL